MYLGMKLIENAIEVCYFFGAKKRKHNKPLLIEQSLMLFAFKNSFAHQPTNSLRRWKIFFFSFFTGSGAAAGACCRYCLGIAFCTNCRALVLLNRLSRNALSMRGKL